MSQERPSQESYRMGMVAKARELGQSMAKGYAEGGAAGFAAALPSFDEAEHLDFLWNGKDRKPRVGTEAWRASWTGFSWRKVALIEFCALAKLGFDGQSFSIPESVSKDLNAACGEWVKARINEAKATSEDLMFDDRKRASFDYHLSMASLIHEKQAAGLDMPSVAYGGEALTTDKVALPFPTPLQVAKEWREMRSAEASLVREMSIEAWTKEYGAVEALAPEGLAREAAKARSHWGQAMARAFLGAMQGSGEEFQNGADAALRESTSALDAKLAKAEGDIAIQGKVAMDILTGRLPGGDAAYAMMDAQLRTMQEWIHMTRAEAVLFKAEAKLVDECFAGARAEAQEDCQGIEEARVQEVLDLARRTRGNPLELRSPQGIDRFARRLALLIIRPEGAAVMDPKSALAALDELYGLAEDAKQAAKGLPVEPPAVETLADRIVAQRERRLAAGAGSKTSLKSSAAG